MISQDIYEGLGRYATDDTTGHLADWMAAAGADLDLINLIVGEGENDEPTWTAAFDLDRAPTSVLAWLAQFVGAQITPAMTDEDARQAISAPDGFAVGKVTSIRSAAERTLTGTKRVVIRERTPDYGTLYVRTIASETPDPDLTEAAIRSQKPWHLVLDYEAATGISYIDLAEAFETYDDLAAADLTYDEVSELEP